MMIMMMITITTIVIKAVIVVIKMKKIMCTISNMLYGRLFSYCYCLRLLLACILSGISIIIGGLSGCEG